MLVNETKNRAGAASQPSDQQKTPSGEIAISVKNLTKKYRIFGHPGDRIKQALTFGRVRFHRGFTALQDVSFEIKKGETIGIIGRNGSGKSTLLQLICGILKPTSRSVKVNGRFDDIAAFADIGEFIDQPVRIYSSGMYVRLGFAVAVHMKPDILIIDEVLAVGDATFQQKCISHISRLHSQGTSIIVVSHNPYHIERLCHRAAALCRGRLSDLMPAKGILAKYH